MKITTKSRYGLRAMICVTKNHLKDKRTTLNKIADKQDVSENYLEQIFSMLKKGGLVVSKRGVYGGYYLAKEPDEITVGDILRILEAPIEIIECLEESFDPERKHCEARDVWNRIFNRIIEEADSITLLDIVNNDI